MVIRNMEKNKEVFKLMKKPPIKGTAYGNVRCGMCYAWMDYTGKYVCPSCGNEYSGNYIHSLWE